MTMRKRLCISYEGLQSSAIVLYDMATYYFKIYDLSYQDFFFAHYAELAFVESLISQTKADLQDAIHAGHTLASKVWHDRKTLIQRLLAERELSDPQIDVYLEELNAYLQLVQKITLEGERTHENVMRAAELSGADFHILHAILSRMLDQPIGGTAFELMWPLEVLGDITGSLIEYADDVAADRYNTYQMLVKLYGKDAPQYLQEEITRYEGMFGERLSALPEEEQETYLNIVARYEQDYPDVSIPEPII